jgi:di/tricarboxylate transporter
MSLDAWILVLIIAFAIAAFVREWLPMDVVALTSLGLLLVFDLVSAEEAITGFGNSAVITVLMMFILSAGFVHSGLVTKLAYRISGLQGAGKWGTSVMLLLLAGIVSAFLNNTAAVAVFMPVAIYVSRHHRSSPSKLLLPLSYTAIFGGTCTLIGTSTNLLVSSLARESGVGEFSMFEFISLGSVFFFTGLAYNVFLPMKYLPPRSVPASLTSKYHLSGFLTELKVPASSRLIGHTVFEQQVSERYQLNVLEIIRGAEKISSDLRNTPIRDEDILLVRGAVEDILAFKERYALLLLTDIKLNDSDLSDQGTILAELQLSPQSSFIGSNLKELDFRRRSGAFVLALNRTGEFIRDKIAMIPLKPWDTLLVFGPRSRVEALAESEDFAALEEREVRLRLTPRWWLPVTVILLVVGLAALGIISILKASILGVVALLVTRSITIQQAYRAVDWTVIFLLAAILPLGIAMENTGLATVISDLLHPVGTSYGPLVMLSLIYLATSLLTSIFSNNATAVLMVPIAIAAAGDLQVDPKPFLMAVAYAASASFMTPMGYQTNAMVFGPGSYRFVDYLKFGAPLTVLFWILATALIPLFWPLAGR